MASATTKTVNLRFRCCRCGRVERYTAPAEYAFVVVEPLLRSPCAGSGGFPCGSLDRRLDVRPAPSGGARGPWLGPAEAAEPA